MSVQAINLSVEARHEPSAIDFDALFRRYDRDLNGFAFRRLRDREAAADVVQDGFIRCIMWHRSRKSPTSMADVSNVLWRAVGNLTVDFIRRKQVRGDAVPLERAAHIADSYPTPDRVVESRQAYQLVKAVLDETPPRQRSAFLLYRLSGCTYGEIADRLGISPTTAARYIVATADRLFLRMAATID